MKSLINTSVVPLALKVFFDFDFVVLHFVLVADAGNSTGEDAGNNPNYNRK